MEKEKEKEERRGSEVARRRPLIGVSVAPSSTSRFYFGPFGPGERVDELRVVLDTTATPGAGESIAVDIRAFGQLPKDDATAFANGRALWKGSKPVLPVINREWWLPVLFEANDEFYLGVEFTESNADTWTGYIAICGGGRFADR